MKNEMNEQNEQKERHLNTVFKFIIVIAIGLAAESLIYIFGNNITTHSLVVLSVLTVFLVPAAYCLYCITDFFVEEHKNADWYGY